jgi:hypothetical protein
VKLFDEGDVALSGPDGRMIEPGGKKKDAVKMDKDTIKAMVEAEGEGTEAPADTRAKRKAGVKKGTKGGKARKKAAAESGSTNAARTAARNPDAAEPAPEPENPMGPNYNPTGTGPILGRTAPPWTKE